MSVKLLTEQHLEFLSLKGNCTGSSASTHVKCYNVGNHMSGLKFYSMLFVVLIMCGFVLGVSFVVWFLAPFLV